jgi:hypothetical protein
MLKAGPFSQRIPKSVATTQRRVHFAESRTTASDLLDSSELVRETVERLNR